MLERVWHRARAAARLTRLVVATDDDRIAAEAERFGGEVMLTAPDHPSGTDRVEEVVRRLEAAPERARFDVVVNIQGDEPFVTPTALDRLVEAFDHAPRPSMATLAEPIADEDELFDPNAVKLVTTGDGRALYFSRSPIPFHRGDRATLRSDFRGTLGARAGGLAGYRKHQGIYAYTRETLARLCDASPSPLELDEGLEQLRALESGLEIRVLESDFHSLGVDTPADLKRAEQAISEVP